MQVEGTIRQRLWEVSAEYGLGQPTDDMFDLAAYYLDDHMHIKQEGGDHKVHIGTVPSLGHLKQCKTPLHSATPTLHFNRIDVQC